MKNLTNPIFIFVFSIFFVACGDQDKNKNDPWVIRNQINTLIADMDTANRKVFEIYAEMKSYAGKPDGFFARDTARWMKELRPLLKDARQNVFFHQDGILLTDSLFNLLADVEDPQDHFRKSVIDKFLDHLTFRNDFNNSLSLLENRTTNMYSLVQLPIKNPPVFREDLGRDWEYFEDYIETEDGDYIEK